MLRHGLCLFRLALAGRGESFSARHGAGFVFGIRSFVACLSLSGSNQSSGRGGRGAEPGASTRSGSVPRRRPCADQVFLPAIRLGAGAYRAYRGYKPAAGMDGLAPRVRAGGSGKIRRIPSRN